MRISSWCVGLVLLSANFQLVRSSTLRQPQDGSDDADEAHDDAMQIAEKLAPDDFDEAGPSQPTKEAGPVKPAVEQQPSVPAPKAVVAAPEPLVAKRGPVKRFGKKHSHEKIAAAQPVQMALKRFGQQQETEEGVVSKDSQAAADAQNAQIAATVAKHAAKVATKVATHSAHVKKTAGEALQDAQAALHSARVDSKHLSKGEKQALKEAERKLKKATEAGEKKKKREKKIIESEQKIEKKNDLAKKMKEVKKAEADKKVADKKKKDAELEAMRKEIDGLRKELQQKEADKAEDDEVLKDLQDQIKNMEEEEKKEDKTDQKSHDEMKAEIERLKAQIDDMDDKQAPPAQAAPAQAPPAAAAAAPEEDVEKYDVKMQPLKEAAPAEQEVQQEVTPVEEKGIDIDTAMPYGDLEPFGREDTAQELTEDSVRQSDDMVDQLERAEVAEEKRSVFRALTRLRGAAITSFDGVARSQTGNIDEYNKVHKWRNTHPLHHLADEESDVSKWAFPDNAD